MPLTKFICPDGAQMECDACIRACRLRLRCVSLSTLQAIYSTERKWDGKPHVTDLLNGPMQTYLKICKDYAVEPQSRAFALLGSTHHKLMEQSSDGYPAEIKVEVMGIQGMADALEPAVGYLSEWNLIDYKSWGGYRVAKALGMEEIGKTPDPSGARYSRGGKWGTAGSPKMVNTFRANPNKADLVNEIIQLNFYRVGLESMGFDIRDLMIQATVRDGGTVTAKGYGVGKLIYMIRVPKVDNSEVMGFLMGKKSELLTALEDDEPRMCNNEECWGGRRCKGYCDVAAFCTQGQELGADE